MALGSVALVTAWTVPLFRVYGLWVSTGPNSPAFQRPLTRVASSKTGAVFQPFDVFRRRDVAQRLSLRVGPLRLVDGCKSHGDELQDVGVIQGRARRAGGVP